MARVLVLTDRHPLDSDWKGAVAWNLIRSLAESQHQVLVLTTLDPETIDVTHPRLTIARPAQSWSAAALPKFLQGILLFQPEVVHTFAVKPSRLWQSLTLWPYLNKALMVLPALKRFSTLFESADLPEEDPSLSWHRGSHRNVVFSPEQKAALQRQLSRSIEVSPLEIEALAGEPGEKTGPPYVLVPAPVGEWNNPSRDLLVLAKFLEERPELHAHVVGGWGDWPASSRRAAWSKMMPVADRLHMLEPMTLNQLMTHSRLCRALWCEPLVRDSWRELVAAQIAASLDIPAHGSRPALNQGSTANFLSRLFAGTLEAWPNP